MKPSLFLNKLDHGRIAIAIAESERKTSGEIRVFVSRHQIEDVLLTAEKEFVRLGMAKTKHRNGVLLFFAPLSQKFAVIGDEAIHQKCGQQHWQTLAEEMQARLKKEQFTDAVVHGVKAAGLLLAKHFPVDQTSGNELPNEVAGD